MKKLISLLVLLSTSMIFWASCNSGSPTTEDNKLIDAAAFKTAIETAKDPLVLDVRTPQEFTNGHIDKAINIDWNAGADYFEQEMAKVPKDKAILLYCQGGGRSAGAAIKLQEMGFTNVKELKGGIMAWNNQYGNATSATPKAKPAGVLDINEFQKMLQSEKLVLVDFNAEWCPPCQKMKPFLYEIQKEHNDIVDILFVDTDKNPELANLYKIEALPTLMLYKSGAKQWHHIGYASKEDLLKQINTHK